MHWSHW